MYIQSESKSLMYKESKRKFSNDYSYHIQKNIDMTMSGKYLYKYPKFEINYKIFDEYPSFKIINQLIENIKRYKKIKDNEVVIGTGANGIIQNIIKILFLEKGNMVTPYLTFDQAEYAVTSLGGYTKRVFMKDTVKINVNNIISSVDNKTRMIYICNPNNPTGEYIANEEILRIANSVHCYIVVDESAIEFTKGKSLSEEKLPDNLIVVRSFSKAYGLSNFRIGYMACSKRFKKLYKENTTSNEVSTTFCQYANKLITNDNYHIKNVNKIIAERKKIQKELKKCGIECYYSKSNTLLTKTYIPDSYVKKLNDSNVCLLLVKDEYNGNHFRIAVQHKKTNKKFINNLKYIFK